MTAWLTATEVSARWSETPASRVAGMFRHLGSFSERHARMRPSSGEIEYSEQAVALVERELRSRGHARRAEVTQ